MLMCKKHWYMVPRALRDRVWETYRPGQERDKSPSSEYMIAHHEAVAAVAKAEGHEAEAVEQMRAATAYR